MMTIKILYLVPHVPSPTKVRSFFQIRGLLEAGHQVTVATLRRGSEDDRQLARLEQIGCEVIWSPLTKAAAALNLIDAMRRGLPLQARFAWSAALMRKIDAHIAIHKPDIIHVEHLRMAVYGLKLVPKNRVIWDAVDHLASLYAQATRTSNNRLWRCVARIEAPRLKPYEQWLTRQFPATLVISSQDRSLFQRDSAFAERIHLAPLGFNMTPQTDTPERFENMLVITGTLDYHPNIASVHYFVREIFPLVLQQQPDVQLQLVGARPTASIVALQSPHVQVTRFVPSIREYLQRATLALAPVIYGSGVQVKVLEAFASATPLVATSIALRGLDAHDQEHVLTADTPTEFAAAILRLLADADLRQRLGDAGRRYVEAHHDLQATTENLVEIYRQVLNP